MLAFEDAVTPCGVEKFLSEFCELSDEEKAEEKVVSGWRWDH